MPTERGNFTLAELLLNFRPLTRYAGALLPKESLLSISLSLLCVKGGGGASRRRDCSYNPSNPHSPRLRQERWRACRVGEVVP